MTPISTQQLFDLYNDTLDKCGMFLLEADDETIEYYIYEEFVIGVRSFLHLTSLNRLYDHGFISEDKLEESALLRKKFIKLERSNEWGFEHFKTSEKWRKIMLLSDKIKSID